MHGGPISCILSYIIYFWANIRKWYEINIYYDQLSQMLFCKRANLFLNNLMIRLSM